MKFGLNLSFGSRDKVRTSFFWSKLDIQNVVTLKMRPRSPKSNHIFPKFCLWVVRCFSPKAHLGQTQIKNNKTSFPCTNGVSVQGQNLCIGSLDRVQTRLSFSLNNVVTLNIGSRSPKSDFFNCPNDTTYKVWSKFIIGSRYRV